MGIEIVTRRFKAVVVENFEVYRQVKQTLQQTWQRLRELNP